MKIKEEICQGIDDPVWALYDCWILIDGKDGLSWDFICSDLECEICHGTSSGCRNKDIEVARIELVEGLRKLKKS